MGWIPSYNEAFQFSVTFYQMKGQLHFVWAPAYWGPGEIDGLPVLPGKASKLLTDHLITGKPLNAPEPTQEK